MNHPYEEILQGETVLRRPPDERHELILDRVRGRIQDCLGPDSISKLLDRRSVVQLQAGTLVRPDLALVTAATGKLWLVAEVIDSYDHRMDTVNKKTLYEDMVVPRLWMIDPRYDNVEIYEGGKYGLALKTILAGREVLTDKFIPGFNFPIRELFGA